MSFVKKVGAAVLAAAMLLCVCCSCNQSATKTIMTVNGQEVPAGVYLLYINNAIVELDEKITEAKYEGDKWAYTDKDVTNAKEWVKETALQDTLELVAVEKKFKEMDLSFTAEEQSNIDYVCNYYWTYMGASYEKLGISFTSYQRVYTVSSMSRNILLALYGEEGKTPVTDDELKTYMDESFMRVNHVLIANTDDEGADLSEEDLETAKTLAEQIYDEAKAATDNEFKQLIITHSADYDSETDDESSLDLGMISPEENSGYVEEFENCAKALKPGEIGFCESEYGWHIIRRYEMFGDDQVDLDDYRENAIITMKEETFNAEKAKWAEALRDQMTLTQEAYDRYDPTDKRFDTEA